MDTLTAAADVNYILTDTSLQRVALRNHLHPTEKVINPLASIEAATLAGGPSANLLDAHQFSGEADLIGGGRTDNLLASKGGGDLWGFDPANPTGAGDKLATRDNYFLSDGTADALDTIHATAKNGNAISFRYYHNAAHTGIACTLPEVGDDTARLVTGSGVPALHLALASGELSILEGSNYADRLTGNKLANVISGRAGDDLLVAHGADVLFGGAGRDMFMGFTPYRFQNVSFVIPGTGGAVAVPPAPAN
jgi:Ca2+-binding RTX toxin-like protein